MIIFQALMNQGVMPEGLGLGLEVPMQEIDFIPIAGSSTDEPESEMIWDESPKQRTAGSDDELVLAKTKRKAEETTDAGAPACAPEPKKSRRLNKGRSKRVKS